jgi:hypothetical protein
MARGADIIFRSWFPSNCMLCPDDAILSFSLVVESRLKCTARGGCWVSCLCACCRRGAIITVSPTESCLMQRYYTVSLYPILWLLISEIYIRHASVHRFSAARKRCILAICMRLKGDAGAESVRCQARKIVPKHQRKEMLRSWVFSSNYPLQRVQDNSTHHNIPQSTRNKTPPGHHKDSLLKACSGPWGYY